MAPPLSALVIMVSPRLFNCSKTSSSFLERYPGAYHHNAFAATHALRYMM